MAKESLIIEISEKGALVVKRNLAGIGKGAKEGQSGVNLLTKALAALGGALIIKQLVGIADAFTLIQNRLRLVTKGTAQLNVVTKELLGISNRTRSSLETNADLFNRLSLSTTELGVSQKDLLNITESLNQAVALSGASTAEASAGLTQLSQGLASGALRGDELRSVLEQLPAVADVIAKQLGITRGELRKFGAEGKITSEVVIEAFKSAREELQNKFNKTIPTVGQAFIVLRNQFISVVGELDKGLGVTRKLAEIVLILAKNMDVLAKAAIAAGIAISTILVGKGIKSAIVGIKALGLLIRANPIGLIVTGVLAAGSALVAFKDDIKVTEDGLVTLGDTGKAVWEFMGEGISGLTKFFGEAFSTASAFVSKQLGGVSFTFADILNAGKNIINTLIGTFVGFGKAVAFIFTELTNFINDAFGIDLANNIKRSFLAVVDFAKRAFSFLLNFAKRVLGAVGFTVDEVSDKLGTTFEGASQNKAIKGAITFGEGVADAFQEGFERDFVGDLSEAVMPALDAVGARAREIATERLAAQKLQQQEELKAQEALSQAAPKAVKADTEFAEVLKNLEEQRMLLRLNSVERSREIELLKIEKGLKRELTVVERESIGAKLALNQSLQSEAALLEEIKGPQEELIERRRALNDLQIEGKISQDEFTESMRRLNIAELETSESFGDGIRLGLLKIEEQTLTTAQVVSDSLGAAFNRTSDALAGFVATGKASFKDLARSILADIAKIIAQKLIAKAISSFATGGTFVVGDPSSLRNFADGGQFDVSGRGGTDSETVAFNATPGETVTVTTPQQQAAMDAGQQQTIVAPPAQVKVVNVTDPAEIPDGMDSPEGEQVIMNMISRNTEAIKRLTT